jgi:hypothetical protein
MINFKEPVEDLINKLEVLMKERYYKVYTECIPLLSKKLASEILKSSLDDSIISAAKARAEVLILREEERLEKERKEREEFE